MKQPRIFFKTRRLAIIAVVVFLALFASHFYGQVKSEFPDGYDAVQTAPNSHKVVFENAFVRVLEVTVPAAGKTEPMHHRDGLSATLPLPDYGRVARNQDLVKPPSPIRVNAK